MTARGKGEIRRGRGVIFDMDGTLTIPVIAFSEMRRKLGVPEGDVLEAVDSWAADKQRWGRDIIEEIEEEGSQKLKLMPGILDLCKFLDERRIPRALITRNNPKAIAVLHDRHFAENPFSPALSRDFRPFKPNPAALLHICKSWQIEPAEAVMIGDSPDDDIVSGNRAGALTILLDTEEQFHDTSDEDLAGEKRPTHIARSHEDVQRILTKEVLLVGL